MLRKYLLILIACLALFAASCSSSGDGDDNADDETPTSEVEGTDDGGEDTGDGDDTGDDDGPTTTVDEDDDGDDTGGGSGGGGGGASRQAYVDAMVENITSDDEMPLEEGQAECLSESWIDTVGHERLAAAGITPESILSDEEDDAGIGDVQLDESDANAMVDTFGDCGIDVTEMFIQSFEQDTTLTPEDRECLEGTFNEDFLRRLFVISFTQGDDALDEDPELMGELMAAVFACPGAMGLEEGDLEGMEGGL